MRQHRAVGLTRCPVGGCDDAPAGVFCPTHRDMVSAPLRSKIGRAMWAMRGRGQGAIPPRLTELLVEAVREINRHAAKEMASL